MARFKKPAGQVRRGPFSREELIRAIESDGWQREKGGRHPCWSHPTRPGKIQIGSSLTAVKKGSFPWRGIRDQGHYSDDELLALLAR